MNNISFKCTLLSDVVLNSSLATEGNMSSLDYIPGSNFLGMVAAKCYAQLSEEQAFEIFHSGKVSFGDAHISKNDLPTYAMPFSLFMDKNKNKIGEDKVYLHHLLTPENQPTKDGNRLQLKQERAGFVNAKGEIIKRITKSMAIKSAQDRDTRTSKDGAMFGFESLGKSQEFIFTVRFQDETHCETVKKHLTGNHRLGKSKNAEFGQVKIDCLETELFEIEQFIADYTLVYAQSNLCFLDETTGQPTFQPTAEQLGLNGGKIVWEKSQIRNHRYSSWNFKRNTTNTQRDCIVKGSVFYVENASLLAEKTNSVGLYQAEGLGRILYNPKFLIKKQNSENEAGFSFFLFEDEKTAKPKEKTAKTTLGKFLEKQAENHQNELNISKNIHYLVYSTEQGIPDLKKISSSQWGGIRAYATNETDMVKLEKVLFEKEKGYLTHGVAYDKYWGKNRDKNLNAFKSIFDTNKQFGNTFIAKFAAEMAKESRKAKEKAETSNVKTNE